MLAKSEYLDAFDTFCELVWTELHMEVVESARAVLQFSEVLNIRRKAMITAYKKYGPVYYNYIAEQLMLPMQNSWIRLNEYKNTHNAKYLVDALNFVMLAYWSRTAVVGTLPVGDDMDLIRMTALQFEERCTDVYDKYLMVLETYSDTDELCYMAILAYILYSEIINPSEKDAFYDNKKDGRVCALAGIYYNSLG